MKKEKEMQIGVFLKSYGSGADTSPPLLAFYASRYM